MLGIILEIDEGRTLTNGLENKKTDDDPPDLASKR